MEKEREEKERRRRGLDIKYFHAGEVLYHILFYFSAFITGIAQFWKEDTNAEGRIFWQSPFLPPDCEGELGIGRTDGRR